MRRHSPCLRMHLHFDPYAGVLRLFRVSWQRGVLGTAESYSSLISVGLALTPFWLDRRRNDLLLIVAGLRLHYHRSYARRYT